MKQAVDPEAHTLGSFLERALARFSARGGKKTAQVFLAAFGKHPGWDDHIEDLGIETDPLVAVKRRLYVQGIGGNIDAGTWDALEADQQVEGFKHVFLWRAPGSLILGRMWSSRDGKGRTRYPMVVCAQCVGLPLQWVLEKVPPCLEQVEKRCVETTSASQVQTILHEALQQLRQQIPQAQKPSGDLVIPAGILAELADEPELGPEHQRLLRVLYQIERQMSAYYPGGADAAAGPRRARPLHIRLPACADSAAANARLWLGLLLSRLDHATPILLIIPLAKRWVDAVVGEPATEQFFCVRAGSRAVPLASEIPYDLDEAFVQRARQQIEESRKTGAQPIIVKAGHAAALRGGLFRKILLKLRGMPKHLSVRFLLKVVIAAILAVALVLVVPKILRFAFESMPVRREAVPEAPRSEEWQKLCASYYAWFGRFHGDLNDQRLNRFRGDPHLREKVVGRIERAEAEGVELDPRRIAGRIDLPLLVLAKAPPAEVMSEDGIRKTRAALEVVSGIEAALIPKDPQNPEGWPALANIAGAAQDFAGRGWTGPSHYLASLPKAVRPGPEKDVVSAMESVLAILPTVQAVEKSWAEIEGAAKAIESSGKASGDAILQGFPAFARKLAASASGGSGPKGLETLKEKLEALGDLSTDLDKTVAGLWSRQVHQQCFIAQSNVHRDFDPDQTVKETYLDWMVEVQDPRFRLDSSINPFNAPALSASIAEAQAGIERLRELEQYQGDKQAEGCRRQFDKAKDRAARGRELPCCRADLARITQECDAVRSQLEKLKDQVDGRVALLGRALPAGDDPRTALRALLSEVQRGIDGIWDAKLKAQLQGGMDEVNKDVADLLGLAWTAAYEPYVSRSVPKLEKALAELEAIKAQVPPVLTDPRPPLRVIIAELERQVAQLAERLNDKQFGEKRRRQLDEIGRRGFWELAWGSGSETERNAVIEGVNAAKPVLTEMKETVDRRLAVVGALRQEQKIASSGSKVIEERWRRRRDELMAAIDDPEQLAKEAGQLAERLKKLDTALAGSLPEISAPRGWDEASAERVFLAKREDTLRQAVTDGMGPEDDNWKTLSKGFNGWRDDIGRLAGDFRDIEGLLDSAYALKEAPPSGRQDLARLYDRWEKTDVFTDFAAAVQAASGRVALLRKIETMGRAELIREANRTDDLAAAFNAWRRLGDPSSPKPWPNDIPGLKEELKIREKLTAAIDRRIQSRPRKDALRAELDREGPRRWQVCFGGLERKDIGEGIKRREEFGVKVDQLPPWVRFDVLLYEFREEVSRFLEEERHGRKIDQDKLLALRDGFVGAVKGLRGGTARSPDVAKSLEQLRAIGRAEGTGDLAKVGPATSLVGPWQAAPSENGRRVTYSWQYRRREHVMEFVRVDPRGNAAGAFYLCRTEVSLGTFLDVIDVLAGQRLEEIMSLFGGPPDVEGIYLWKGPRAWKWQRDPARIKKGDTWLAIGEAPPEERSPSLDHPMQYVSPAAAMYFARLMGCRLPTSAEWKAAYEAHEKSRAAGRWNLRDKSWQGQWQRQLQGRPCWPDAGIFWPAGFPPGRRKVEGEAQPRTDEDDGVTWFGTVASDADRTFHHLAGNVAEFVYDDSSLFEEELKDSKDLSAAKVNAVLARDGKLFVIGGSALSAPELWDKGFDERYPVDMAAARKGCSDVGLRLVFSAPSESPASQLWRLLAVPGYLTGSSVGGASR